MRHVLGYWVVRAYTSKEAYGKTFARTVHRLFDTREEAEKEAELYLVRHVVVEVTMDVPEEG